MLQKALQHAQKRFIPQSVRGYFSGSLQLSALHHQGIGIRGIAEYFNIDPSIVRLVWAALVIMGGTGILLYIIAAIILPRKSQVYPGY